MPSFLLKNDKRRSGFGPCIAVAIMMGPSLAYGSPACMTQSEARAKFPKAHLYWHGREHCWNDRPAFSSSALAAVPAPSSPPAQAAVPVLALEFGVPLEKIRRALLGDTTQAAVPAPSSRPAQAVVPAASPRSAQAAVPAASPRPAQAAVTAPSSRPAPAAVPMSSLRPVSTTEGLGSQCQLPCE
jgi:hypothetical protein